MLPRVSAKSGQRRPGISSAVTASSSPPPQRSPSMSTVLTPCPAAAWASQIAVVVAPAPPLPPMTPMTVPPRGVWRSGHAEVFSQPGGGLG